MEYSLTNDRPCCMIKIVTADTSQVSFALQSGSGVVIGEANPTWRVCHFGY